MAATDKPVTILAESECWQLLSSVPVGRLVTAVDGRPEIFPVNFAVQRRTVLFRTSEGTKLIGAGTNTQVVFEADESNPAEGWSVIVKGTARSVQGDDLEEAEDAGLLSWAGSDKSHYVRIKPMQVTGRRFRFGS